ncbi:ester cyclase [Kovacikia minuta CCNUW1]|uniref:ester cyclase n=1 Tax=Kovacikia minuta TaxID=2931930 RepID=UPI001CCDBBBB|nr:ester cyclase [Kovacikia minuta]UBF26488.1 ester cyclase [Kovacikia minuta CCNUW1]
MKTPREVIQIWVDAHNARDAHSAADLYHEDATNIQVAVGIPVQGKQAILEGLIQFFQAFPDNYTRIENLFEDGEWAIVEWSGGGTFLGEFAGVAPTGKKFTLQGCGFFHITKGKIRFQRGYWDKMSWFSQIEIPLS